MIRLKVEAMPGWTFQNFVDMHTSMTKRKLKVITNGEKEGIVEISYTAIGASKEDLMRPYRVRDKWQKFYVSVD